MSTTTAASGEHRRADVAAANLDAARGIARTSLQQAEDDTREVALERAERLTTALALLLLSLEARPAAWIPAPLDDCDPVHGGVQLAISVATQAMASLRSGGRFKRGHARQASELGIAAERATPPVSPMILAAIPRSVHGADSSRQQGSRAPARGRRRAAPRRRRPRARIRLLSPLRAPLPGRRVARAPAARRAATSTSFGLARACGRSRASCLAPAPHPPPSRVRSIASGG